jgi:hypothetical protein
MRKLKKPIYKPKRKVAARSLRSPRSVEAASRAEVLCGFDRAEPTPPAKEIQLMTEEERKIYVHPSKN